MENNRIRVKKINFRNKQLIRLSVFRSNRGMTAALIDDKKGITIGSASTLKMDVKLTPMEKVEKLGKEIAAIAKTKKVSEVVFDRKNYKYHGKVKALADAVRQAGLKI